MSASSISEQFLAALGGSNATAYETLLTDDVVLRMHRWDCLEVHRSRARVVQRLQDEWSSWCEPLLSHRRSAAEGDCVALEFRIQSTEGRRYVEHNRAAFLTLAGGAVAAVDIFCPQPVPSARRKGWIAPTTLTEEEINSLLCSLRNSQDLVEWSPPGVGIRLSLRERRGGNDVPHPMGNRVESVQWAAEEADEAIEEMIDFHRRRNIGFTWFVGPFDTPPDLGERLIHHGLVLGGEAGVMGRMGLTDLEIPVNTQVEIELLDGSNQSSIDAALEILRIGFNVPPEHLTAWSAGWIERVKNVETRKEDMSFLARLGGTPAGTGRLLLGAGTAYLANAATLPDFRGQRVYSTLLRHRLAEALARGYNLATVDAEPMSRRVLSRYGFKEYAKTQIYAWMPVIDMDVVRGLVPQD